MLFPIVSLEDWLKKHPQVTVAEVSCFECSATIRTEQPFITPDYVGVAAFKCPVCNVPHKAFSGVPYSKAELSAWEAPV